jgi:hypothetical protein
LPQVRAKATKSVAWSAFEDKDLLSLRIVVSSLKTGLSDGVLL